MSMQSKNIIREEFIGLNVEIHSNKDKKIMFKGKIVDETKNTFTIESDGKKERKIMMKKNNFFIIDFNGKKVSIDGNLIIKKHEDRIKIK